MRRSWIALVAVVAMLVCFGASPGPLGTARASPNLPGPVHAAAGPASPLVFKVVSPAPNSTIYASTPTIEVSFSDVVAQLNPATVSVFVDGLNETASGLVVVGTSTISYPIPALLKLVVGANNATVTGFDADHHEGKVFWQFTVTSAPPPSSNPLSGIKPITLLLYLGLGAALVGAGFGGYILFLKQTTRFTFRRYFATHPVRRTYLVLYLPLLVAFMAMLFGLSYVASTPGLPPNAVDYVFIIVTFIALTPFGIDARQEMLRIRSYERAFAQFLFEMADAMRGGIDPAKALVELSKTHTNILAKHLRIAADAVRLGRPFDAILREMVASMQSRLITRYAGLIADASRIGGETATVVYRAAKDMDDFVKIEEEREKQLMLPVAVIYIAFAVLMAVLFALLYIAPTLGTLNVSFIGLGNPLAGSGGSAAATQVPRLSFGSLKERFFELMIINALGTGAIIGAFTEGRARYGILHSLSLVGATVVAFLILFPG